MESFLPIFGFAEGELPLIAGPCSAESRRQVLDTAMRLHELTGLKVFRAGVWKPRTKPGGFEGMGELALEWLVDVRALTGMAIATEVATKAHTLAALEAGIDILWIGARTTTNPFAVQEIADTIASSGCDVAVMVKNPANPDLELWDGALQRFHRAGIRRLGAVHRGFTPYGPEIYRNSPCWNIPTELRLRYPSLPVFCDPSHIGGKREFIHAISQTALDMGFYGLMAEVHCNPDCALSDAAQQLTPDDFASMVSRLTRCRRNNAPADTTLADLRARIDAADAQLLDILASRMAVAREIGRYKSTHNLSAVQPDRYNDIIRDRCSRGADLEMDPKFIRTLMLAIHDESVRQQLKSIKNSRSPH